MLAGPSLTVHMESCFQQWEMCRTQPGGQSGTGTMCCSRSIYLDQLLTLVSSLVCLSFLSVSCLIFPSFLCLLSCDTSIFSHPQLLFQMSFSHLVPLSSLLSSVPSPLSAFIHVIHHLLIGSLIPLYLVPFHSQVEIEIAAASQVASSLLLRVAFFCGCILSTSVFYNKFNLKPNHFINTKHVHMRVIRYWLDRNRRRQNDKGQKQV